MLFDWARQFGQKLYRNVHKLSALGMKQVKYADAMLLGLLILAKTQVKKQLHHPIIFIGNLSYRKEH